ncbi:diaminopimelate decarboxylase [Clostridium pasteurianum DSM 525 = ATCC 6013]|uniref:Diaminopimelate decarboxylase n=1 Tax=Clostridium pasteurianum DSM 525 = ATCC 6013 TaxID=1262449 RepID=A0A0H3J603_CLOPA|nr:diaminopimelate decarboxylase [Clostridium pasteurianum]AJA47333.1 diaminopimelate decarboxylase [Clostridium pasteurianum DSM 525 = ATCC 6013]AJA51321.1 diaminopimelate decarboxylase [Clostridium pasteurianum DSM 525 = ATCC 6013]AOZ74668.1 diaminopimelate decarboxylase [Clostridium pasteurianum DSM 525 = ATCC 6013]AOZ78465.1 diaminopimelate decarboxylase [Clostridium pasteurianum]ELP58670.1 diaminopimelate decarboxylase [Clostridium pasteurianum DSM 525 = ATCC 6013]
MKLFGTMEAKENELYIGGISTTNLCKEFGTPLYVIDEELVRKNCRDYCENFNVKEGKNKVAYAGKAFLPTAMCQIIDEEGLNLDVVSGGELYTAHKAGFPMEKVLFHGNNKTIDEIKMGINFNVGRFVVDNFYELEKINEIAKEDDKIQKILLRITPGIEAHTHDYIKTGQVDSKFGFTLLNSETINAVKKAISLPNIKLMGLHCHIGSQIFEIKPYEEEVDIMLDIIKTIKDELNYEIEELDLGGGFGIYYTEADKPREAEEFCSAILKRAESKAKEIDITLPTLIIEPGRSIIGNAGTTLYTVGSIKDIPEIRKYISVDGGMTDNIRPSLYQAEYECAIANKLNNGTNEKVTVAGKCCESGDILLTDVDIAKVESGDILIVTNTGAYGYSMANNYNKIPKAAVVLVKDGHARLICRRESYEDVLRNELLLL